MISDEFYRIYSALTIIDRLYKHKSRPKFSNVFDLLVQTILSQNTNWKNVEQAVKTLRSQSEINVDSISQMNRTQLSKLIKPAGIHNIKSERILEAAAFINNNYNGEITKIINLPPNYARKKLTEIPGVGLKTADVILLFSRGFPILPVDTHITRIAKRLKVVGKKAKYEEIRTSLEKFVKPHKRLDLHLALIRFGREMCKALNPNCYNCPLQHYSDISRKGCEHICPSKSLLAS